MIIAIENFEGRIYRVITSIGLGAFMHGVSSLLDIGLKDVLADSAREKSGYDSWFVTTPEMLNVNDTESKSTCDPATDIFSNLEALNKCSETERQSLILSRVGQGQFRTQLLSYWNGCVVTGADCVPLLKASHIKPWRASNNQERLDLFNGLLLSPNIDAAFDSGYITFDSKGIIMLSNEIAGVHAFQLNIKAKSRINQKLLRPQHEVYLEYHRQDVFRG